MEYCKTCKSYIADLVKKKAKRLTLRIAVSKVLKYFGQLKRAARKIAKICKNEFLYENLTR